MSQIPLEIIQVCKFGSQETFLIIIIIIINIENICAILRFFWKTIHFSGFFDE